MTFSRATFLLIAIICALLIACESSCDNNNPTITSASSIEATGGIFFCYQPEGIDLDNPNTAISFEKYPSWLTADTDSLYGTPPDGFGDTSFVVIASNRSSADTLEIAIDMIPCLVVYGDTRTYHDTHRQVVAGITGVYPATVFHTGDLVDDGRVAAQWDSFNLITEQMRASAEFFPAAGNHEKQSQLYFDNFELPGNEQWYSVDRNGIHFIVLNSYVATDPVSEQYQWLENDLAQISDSTNFTIVIFHHPPYSTGPHTEDERGLRDTWVPLFEQYGVDVVFNGHDHCYERSFCGGIYYIVTGGGGAPLYDQERQHECSQIFLKSFHFCKLSTINDRLIVNVYDLAGEQIDRFELLSGC